MTTPDDLADEPCGVDSTSAVRRLDLPDGRSLTVRRGTHADIPGLGAVYAGLSDDDVYLRFFSAHRPDVARFERMTSIRDGGGELFVVEIEIATDGGVPSWPPISRRPRVLVEGRTAWRGQETADRRGLDVVVLEPGVGVLPAAASEDDIVDLLMAELAGRDPAVGR